MPEIAINTSTVFSVLPFVKGDTGGGFQGPSIDEFFPGPIFFAGTPFELNRIMLIRLLVVVVLFLVLVVGTRNLKIVPTRAQVVLELVFGFVRNGIVIGTLGEKNGKRFMGVLMTIFFVTLGMNLTGTIPGLQIAGTSVIGIPLLMSVIAFVLFIYAGIKQHGLWYFKNALILPGLNPAMAIFLAVLELLSTFIVRPVTLTLRLLMNMVAGHMLLALCFLATNFFFFTVLANGNAIGLLGIGTFAFGIAFTALELFVAALQAYVFTILTAIYIQMALAEEH
ncbi:MAG: F0F1 ATP synthase subunit A [Acidobacteria bacterium]|nr:F0F1 ATP synthase subunit A [Acidobacteriota bacterium]